MPPEPSAEAMRKMAVWHEHHAEIATTPQQKSFHEAKGKELRSRADGQLAQDGEK